MSLNASLLLWLGTFEVEGQPLLEQKKDDVYYHLADGFVCARVLNRISPEHFSSEWLKGITPVPPNGSWPLRFSNLKRILIKIHDFISDIQNIQSFEISNLSPDLTTIAQNFDPEQISRLIQLILICAINCNNKQYYIQVICGLPTRVKQDIKEAIERVLKVNELTSNDHLQDASTSRTMESGNLFQGSPARRSSTKSWRDSSQASSDTSRRNDSQIPSNNADLHGENMEEIRQAHHDLKLKLRQLQLEKDQLVSENEILRTEKSSSKVGSSFKKAVDSTRRFIQGQTSEEGAGDSDQNDSLQLVIAKENKKLTIELQKMKEELFKIELERDEFKQRANHLKKDLERVILERDDYRDKANQAKRLQDELDEHEDNSDKVAKLEKWKNDLLKKNADLKKKLDNIEENNKNHIKKIVRLEKETGENGREIKALRDTLREAQFKSTQETHRADIAESNLARLSEDYNAIRSDNEKLYRTIQLVKSSSRREVLEPDLSTIDENAQVNNNDSNAAALNQLNNQDTVLQSMSISALEMKERIVRLEYENELLQEKLNFKGDQDDQATLSGYLEQANSRCAKLEIDNRQMKKRIHLLESHLRDRLMSQTNLNNPSTSGTSSQSAQELSSENSVSLMSRVEELQKLLFQKEHELMDLENKYKRNLQKAKDVIKALNNNQQPMISSGSLHHPSCMPSATAFNYSSLDETVLLKKQLREREDRLLELEREFKEFKKVKEIHERIIVSAFCGLVSRLDNLDQEVCPHEGCAPDTPINVSLTNLSHSNGTVQKSAPDEWSNTEKRLEQATLTSPPHTAGSSMNHSKHSH